MSAFTVSVVIPTFNRKPILQKTLQGYLRQSVLHNIAEILLIDDGSTDTTEELASDFMPRLPIRYLRQSNQGPAAARNWGIREAKAPLILFGDDDIIPSPGLVAQHVQSHTKYPQSHFAVQGYVTWSPEVCPTPFMNWYGERGALFGFHHIRRQQEADFRYFYTCNVSLKTDFLRASGGFNQSFKSAAFEDTEFGFRLQQAGMRLLYNPNALGYHCQHFTFDEACRRGQRVAAGRAMFIHTPAGRFIMDRDNRISVRTATWVVRRILPLLAPMKHLLDSDVRLPDALYRSFYWYHVQKLDTTSTDLPVGAGPHGASPGDESVRLHDSTEAESRIARS